MYEITRRTLTRVRMLRLLDELESATGPAVSLYLPPGRTAAQARALLNTALGDEGLPEDMGERMTESPTGAILFWGESYRILVLPPFPVTEERLASGYEVGLLRALLQQDLTLALILIRLGAYAIGVYQGDRLVASKGGTGLVHGRHRAGGQSQRRFERHREKQMEYFFERVCGHIREMIEPRLSQIDYVLYGGERNTLLAFLKQCRFAQQLDSRTLERVLDIREPRQATLFKAVDQAWGSRVLEWENRLSTDGADG